MYEFASTQLRVTTLLPHYLPSGYTAVPRLYHQPLCTIYHLSKFNLNQSLITLSSLGSKPGFELLKCPRFEVRKQTTSKRGFETSRFKDPLVSDLPSIPLGFEEVSKLRWGRIATRDSMHRAECDLEGASVYATDHGTRRRRGGVSRICRSGHRSSASSDGETMMRQVGRTNRRWHICCMIAAEG